MFAKLAVLAVFAALLALTPQTHGDDAAGQDERPDRARVAAPLPAGTRTLRDVAYGEHPRQRYDVYLPPSPERAPVVILVHGGGWRRGDRDHPGLVPAKAAHWLPRGYVLVSTGYRLLPDAAPLQQAGDVARAVAAIQRAAPGWGADPARTVLVGHSAGAHLVALLAAKPVMLDAAGAMHPRGVVALDSAALDVPGMMAFPRIPRLFHDAFGSDRDGWIAASPWHQLSRGSLPLLAVCSTFRPDACPQALAQRAESLGVRVEVQPEALGHMEINRQLGEPSAYTRRVSAFIDGLLR
jgi:arylformamidase